MSEANHYDKLSDFEISERVAKKQGILYIANVMDKTVWVKIPSDMEQDQEQIAIFDYCNNWNDIMPIAEENKIDIKHKFEGFEITHQPIPTALGGSGEDYDYVHSDENIKRAIAITYLKMMES